MPPLSRILRRAAIAAVIIQIVLLTGCVDWTSHQSALDPKGPLARQQYDTFMVTLYVTTFLWITVGGALLYTVWRFRRRRHTDPNVLPKQSHGHPMIEVGLILLSAIMLAIIAVPTLRGIYFMKKMSPEMSARALDIEVTGYQWWWEFRYPDSGVVTANEFAIPVGRPIRLKLRTSDVNHSFWLPKLGGKTDLIAGQDNMMWLQADEAGTYYGQCAEFCGEAHAYMLFRAHALPAAEYEKWVAHQTSGPAQPLVPPPVPNGPDPAQAVLAGGRQAFQKYCVTCHRIGELGGQVGPNLTHLASRTTIAAGWLDNNAANLRRWIAEPSRIKPNNLMWTGTQGLDGLSKNPPTPAEVEALTAYLLTLK